MGYDLSSGSCFNMNSNNKINNNNLSRNMSKSIKIMKNNTQLDIDKTKSYALSLRNNSFAYNKITENEYMKNTRNILLNQNADISTIFDPKYRYSNIFDCFEENKSNQSFLESILYCLFNIKKLTDYFLNNKEKEKKINNSFYNEYLKIIEFLNQKKNNFIDELDSNNINNKCDIEENDNEKYLISFCPDYNYQKILRLISFQNSSNIISKIISIFHLELNKSSIQLVDNDLPEKLVYHDEEKKKEIYQNFLKECKENNNSIIFEMFYGIKEKQFICSKCKHSFYKYELMNVIEFSLYKLAIYAKEINNHNRDIINIMDCLNYYKKEKKPKDENLKECTFCNDLQNYSFVNTICKYPEIFIICFHYDNNFSEEEKCDIKIDFDENIKILNDEYNLIGIISLQKKIQSNDQDDDDIYVAYCRDHLNKKWIYYNDKNTNNFNFENNKADITPIVLFYQKLKI